MEFLSATPDERTGFFHVKFGAAADDPHPFIIILKPPYVARKLGRERATRLEIEEYVRTNVNHLKAIAQNVKDRGLTTQELD
jgi:hypothetical protein